MIRKSAPVIALALVLSAPAAAQKENTPSSMTPEMKSMMEAYEKAGTPGAQHKRLAAMAGEYDLRVKSWHDPKAEPTIETGTATRKMILGDRVMLEEVRSEMMGQPFTGQGLLGFDNVSKKYWSTWNDSMSTGVMISEGTCDAKGACTFTGVSNDPISKKPVKARMTSRWTDPDTELFEMYMPGPDKKEAKMMEITYRKRVL